MAVMLGESYLIRSPSQPNGDFGEDKFKDPKKAVLGYLYSDGSNIELAEAIEDNNLNVLGPMVFPLSFLSDVPGVVHESAEDYSPDLKVFRTMSYIRKGWIPLPLLIVGYPHDEDYDKDAHLKVLHGWEYALAARQRAKSFLPAYVCLPRD